MDDSLVYEKGIFVYSHALVLQDDAQATRILVFSGSNREIYRNEQAILDFIMVGLQDGMPLYACGHYIMYPSIWPIVFAEVNGSRLPRAVKRTFTEAHHSAKAAAKKELERILAQTR